MGYDIGLDFGTTYSVIAKIVEEYDASGSVLVCRPVACEPGVGKSASQDSIVRRKDGALSCGTYAREKAGGVVYDGFKMMLAETNQESLKKRHYDETYTPAKITEEYLRTILTNTLGITAETPIDKIVVGVPAIWMDDIATLECRQKLQEILESFDFVGEVETVSEPAAACAYFANNYQRSKGKAFDGRILLVDYGGGTLDITLCDVKPLAVGNEVTMLEQSGAGLNQEGCIGKAGLAYIEAIVKKALTAGKGMTEDEIMSHRRLSKWKQGVELMLINYVRDIESMFKANPSALTRMEIKNDVLEKLAFSEDDEEELPVTYGMLLEAYDEVIRPVLKEQLEKMTGKMDARNINYRVNGDDDFKIAMVGGFCNFYLTREQVEQFFGRPDKSIPDPRFEDLITDERECEKAIAYGAALIANEVTSVKTLAPYHLGVAKGSKDNLEEWHYAIRKGEEVEYGKPVIIKDNYGDETIFVGSEIPMLVFSLDDRAEYAQWGEVPAGDKNKLSLKKDTWIKLGLSLDKSMRITLHKYIVADPQFHDKVVEESSVRLSGDIYKLLGKLTQVKKVSI